MEDDVRKKLYLPEFDPQFLKNLKITGFEDDATRRLLQAQHILQQSQMVSLRPLLPLMLSLKGDPYTLDKHFPFEPFFRTRFARKTLFKTGRQVAKSTGLAARGLVMANCIPWFSILYIAPLYETIRRFSQNYMRPFIETSPVKKLFIATHTMNSVLQRTFINNSQMLFTFAFLDAERTRGISADLNSYDEIQSMDRDFIPIIRETMSGSKWKGIENFAGTPLGLENCIEGLWQDSSQAEWVMKCIHCGYWNVPCLTHDLDAMIGPLRDDISEAKPGVICAKCRKPLHPQLGRWVHAHPDRRWKFAGYHIPQIIMPNHFGDYEKWSELLGKRAGKGNTPVNVFYNEVCGESYDTGSRLCTVTDIKRAATLPWPNKLEEAKKYVDEYIYRVLCVDWGGGGEEEVSFTSMAVLGMLPDGHIHCLWGLRSLTPNDHEREARLCVQAVKHFGCQVVAHDYTGAGSLRETFLVQAGFPLTNIIPIAYVRAASGHTMTMKLPTKMNPREHYQVDKTRSLLMTINHIKNGWLKFFQYDYVDSDDEGLLHDFIALVDEKVESRLGKDVYTIIRDPHMHDDFAQAVNIGCMTLWKMSGKWPNIAEIAGISIDQETLDAMHPPDKSAWQNML